MAWTTPKSRPLVAVDKNKLVIFTTVHGKHLFGHIEEIGNSCDKCHQSLPKGLEFSCPTLQHRYTQKEVEWYQIVEAIPPEDK